MNFQRKEKKSEMKIIYVTLAVSLAIMAVLVIFAGAWRRNTTEPTLSTTAVGATLEELPVIAHQTTAKDTETTTETETQIPENTTHAMAEEPVPNFISPVSGHVMKDHSDSTPVYSVTMNDYRPHTGVDIYAPMSADVFAAAEGVVKDIWEDPMSGYCISITHSGGAVTVYKNLSPTIPDTVSAGDEVAVGQVIGTVGESSLLEIAEEPHLHFEIEINGVSVDPEDYIAFTPANAEYED